MATLTTQNTWHGNPRGTVAYADTAYVNSVTSPYIHIPSGGSASTVPTYVSRQGPTTMVLDAAIPLLAGTLPFTTVQGLFWAVPLVPTGVWAKGTTLKFDATNTYSPATQTDTLTVTLPQNVTQDNIIQVLTTLINDSGSAFRASSTGNLFLVTRLGFSNANDNSASIFTAITITAP